jgi:hypothetical protein
MPRGVYQRTEEHIRLMLEGVRAAGGRAGERNANWRGGKTKHPLYLIYSDMKRRCTNPKHKRYADYGGRGIRVYQPWLDDFWQFVADVGERPEGKTQGGRAYWQLDRIDNEGNYEPGNVRWASPSEQASNTRPKTLQSFCRRGHEMTDENTYVYPNGARRCRECSKIHEANRPRRKK